MENLFLLADEQLKNFLEKLNYEELENISNLFVSILDVKGE